MNIGKRVRLNRIFSHPSGRLCSVAVDHFIGYGKLTTGGGLSTLPDALKKVIAGMPGAVTMSKGTAMNCWEPYAGKVPLILQAGCCGCDRHRDRNFRSKRREISQNAGIRGDGGCEIRFAGDRPYLSPRFHAR